MIGNIVRAPHHLMRIPHAEPRNGVDAVVRFRQGPQFVVKQRPVNPRLHNHIVHWGSARTQVPMAPLRQPLLSPQGHIVETRPGGTVRQSLLPSVSCAPVEVTDAGTTYSQVSLLQLLEESRQLRYRPCGLPSPDMLRDRQLHRTGFLRSQIADGDQILPDTVDLHGQHTDVHVPPEVGCGIGNTQELRVGNVRHIMSLGATTERSCHYGWGLGTCQTH